MNANENGLLLVVDDDPMNRDMLTRRLMRRGYRALAAPDGPTALRMLEEQPFDMVLLDVMMPGMSGLEVLKIVRQRLSVAELPVIMATAQDQSGDVVEAFRLGASDYVTKPLDFNVVVARVQVHLRLKHLADLKDEFLRIASHDLKNPLTLVRGGAATLRALLKPGMTLTPELYDLLERVEHNARVMQQIIEDFLEFRALEDGQLQLLRVPIDLNALAQQVVSNQVDYANSKGIRLRADLASLPVVLADSARLRQVVENLVGNAVKFGFVGTEIVVQTACDARTVSLNVRDSGPGLTPDDLNKLFTKYARLSNKPTGGEKSSGLGLAIAKQMVDLHGGELGAYNNPDVGATFWLRLPLD